MGAALSARQASGGNHAYSGSIHIGKQCQGKEISVALDGLPGKAIMEVPALVPWSDTTGWTSLKLEALVQAC